MKVEWVATKDLANLIQVEEVIQDFGVIIELLSDITILTFHSALYESL